MTEKQINKRNWLNRAFCAEKKLNALYDKCKRDRERAERVSQVYGGVGKGKSDSKQNGTQKLLDALADSIEEYSRYASEYAEIRREVENAIRTLNDAELEAIFIHRHLNYAKVDKIAEIMHYSNRTIIDKYKKGLEKFAPNFIEFHF